MRMMSLEPVVVREGIDKGNADWTKGIHGHHQSIWDTLKLACFSKLTDGQLHCPRGFAGFPVLQLAMCQIHANDFKKTSFSFAKIPSCTYTSLRLISWGNWIRYSNSNAFINKITSSGCLINGLGPHGWTTSSSIWCNGKSKGPWRRKLKCFP